MSVGVGQWDSTLEPASSKHAIQSRVPEAARAVRLGFRQIKGFREASARRIESARVDAAFGGIDDLIRRTGLRKDEIERLAEAGALESLVPGRRNAVWQARAPRVAGLFTKIELIEPEIVDIAAARSPAMMRPDSPDGTCSTMNFGKTASPLRGRSP